MDSLLLFLATFHNGFSDFGTICKYLTVAHRSEMLEVISRRIFYMQNIHISIRKKRQRFGNDVFAISCTVFD
jgi:energy-converting hydrogenase Eha subunit C